MVAACKLHIYVASPTEFAVDDQIDHGSMKSSSVSSQCSFPCVVPLVLRLAVCSSVSTAPVPSTCSLSDFQCLAVRSSVSRALAALTSLF